MVDLQLAHRVALDLQAFIEQDPRLCEFRPAVAELVENARRLCDGDLTIGSLRSESVSVLPDREAAEHIVRITGLMPGPDGTEDDELLLALGQLHGNVAHAVMHAVFASFPQVVRDAVSAMED